jgi:hypothetical protein
MQQRPTMPECIFRIGIYFPTSRKLLIGSFLQEYISQEKKEAWLSLNARLANGDELFFTFS